MSTPKEVYEALGYDTTEDDSLLFVSEGPPRRGMPFQIVVDVIPKSMGYDPELSSEMVVEFSILGLSEFSGDVGYPGGRVSFTDWDNRLRLPISKIDIYNKDEK